MYAKLNETIGQSQNYEAVAESKNEFTDKLTEIEEMTDLLEKEPTYSKGLLKYIDRQILGSLVSEYLALTTQSNAQMHNYIDNTLVSKVKMLMLYQRDHIMGI